MAYVYRYIDNSDGIIKYVGIVWSENRTLTQRIYEHQRNEEWCKNRSFTIEYIEENINTRTDAEYFESHYISLYGTDKYFNEKKIGWGISSFLPNRENDWKVYDRNNIVDKVNDHIYKLTWTIDEDIDIISIPVKRKKCKMKKVTNHKHCLHCGSNNIYKKETNASCGQMYCLDCGEWVCQGNRDFEKYYTPEYNGEYEYEGEKIKEYVYYTMLYGQKYPQATEDVLTSVFDGCYNSLALYPRKNYTSIFTYAINENEIEESKARLIKHIINKKKQEICKNKKRLSEIEKEKKELPNIIKSLKSDLELFNSRFSDLLLNY